MTNCNSSSEKELECAKESQDEWETSSFKFDIATDIEDNESVAIANNERLDFSQTAIDDAESSDEDDLINAIDDNGDNNECKDIKSLLAKNTPINKKTETHLHKTYADDVGEKGFFIEGDSVNNFLRFLDENLAEDLIDKKNIVLSNLKNVFEIGNVLAELSSKCAKVLTSIPHQIDPNTGEFTIQCGMCPLHCPPNLPSKILRSRGRPSKFNQY